MTTSKLLEKLPFSMFILIFSFVAWPTFVLLLCKKTRRWPFDN